MTTSEDADRTATLVGTWQVHGAGDRGSATLHSHLGGAVLLEELGFPDEGRSEVTLRLRAGAGTWTSYRVSSRDGEVGAPVAETWEDVTPTSMTVRRTDPGADPEVLSYRRVSEDVVDPPAGHLPKVTSDFDFLTGTWHVTNRRLRSRLTGCQDWDEFENTYVARTHLNGLVSVDESSFSTPVSYQGMTFRTFDIGSRTWLLHWLDSRTLRMDPAPVRGRFADGVGEFVAEDEHEGVPILCRFRWLVLSATAATWEQAFSVNGGLSWETNWTNAQRRIS